MLSAWISTVDANFPACEVLLVYWSGNIVRSHKLYTVSKDPEPSSAHTHTLPLSPDYK